MKALRVILIIVLVLVAAILIVPLFSPATAEVSAETTIDLRSDRIFPKVASFIGRDLWDPWLTQDSTADAKIEPNSAYVGSTYSWTGEKVGSGRMEVISVIENEYIESHLWFGEVEEPALVEWKFEPVDGGTHITWSFSQETTYPIGRLGMMFGKIFLKQSFELGLANLKELMESIPNTSSALGTISVVTLPAMTTLVADGAGIKVNKMGVDAAQVKAVAYPEVEAVSAMHTGPYEEFTSSYDELGAYIAANEIQVSGEAFEHYQVGMQTESDPILWQTLIAFPLK